MAISSIALKAYQSAVQADRAARAGAGAQAAGKAAASGPSSFTANLKDSLKEVNDLQIEKEGMILEFASGKSENVHELMISLQKAGLAMKMTSTVRNKLMEAYRELSHMTF